MSAEESSPLEGTSQYEPERSMRLKLIIIGGALVFIMGAYAYVGTRDRSLEIDAGELVSQQKQDGLVCCMIHSQHGGEPYLLLVTRELDGEFRRVALRVMEIEDDGAPREINAIGSPFNSLLPTRFSVVDQTVYIPLDGDEQSGVWTIDLSDPAWPQDAGFTQTASGTARQLSAYEDLLAINHTSEIVILDISDRAGPQPAAWIEQPESGVMTLQMIGPSLFVNDAVVDEFRIFDLSDPAKPDLTGIHRNPDGPGDLVIEFGAEGATGRLNQSAMPSKYLDFTPDIEADLVYVAASDLGLRVLDISRRDSPEITAEMETPDRAVRVAREGDRLYLLGASEGDWETLTYSIHTVDISDPLNPELIHTINGIVAEPGIQAFTVDGDRLYVGLFETLLVFDVSE